MKIKRPGSVDQFIETFPKATQDILQKIRQTIRSVAPQTTEAIRYGIPTFQLDRKNLVHFSAYTRHIGFYPAPSGIAAFKKELSKYKNAKGSVQFQLDEPIPYSLIARMVKFRVAEELSKARLERVEPMRRSP